MFSSLSKTNIPNILKRLFCCLVLNSEDPDLEIKSVSRIPFTDSL